MAVAAAARNVSRPRRWRHLRKYIVVYGGLTFFAFATDADLPKQTVSYSLLAGAPVLPAGVST